MKIAFKEWAVICRALAEGRQSLILRKGGIAEVGGLFRPEHSRFWLFPTYLHQAEQEADGLKPDYREWIAEERAKRPTDGRLLIGHFVEVVQVDYFDDLAKLHELSDHHIWSAATVEKRFHYRTPGLYVLTVRTFQIPQPHLILNTPEYDGCKTWVELTEDLADAPANAVTHAV